MIIIIMGVSGCGKTTVGQQLADRLGWPFFDGDDFHPPANIDKMSRGLPLNDEDRSDWLAAIADRMRQLIAGKQSGVFACSALKQKYRDQLSIDPTVRFVYLQGSYDLIWSRMQARTNHYMKPEMLASQFAALEEPRDTLTLDIARSPAEVVETIIAHTQELKH
jgi:gluconokinase